MKPRLPDWPPGPAGVVGRPAARVDGRERATGAAVYAVDVALPGMLHGAILRSPYAYARMRALSLDRAAAAAGVRAAIGPDDLDVLERVPGFVGAHVAAIANAVRDATGVSVRTLPLTRAAVLEALADRPTRPRGRAPAVAPAAAARARPRASSSAA
jgi:xanthine dehydrogenase YagR molybdenum-binding subunit